MRRLLSPLYAAMVGALLLLPGTVRADLTLTDIHAALNGVWLSGVAWGDYDNDGRLDILLSGDSTFAGGGAITRIYHNNGGTFSIGTNALLGVSGSDVAWGDYDADGDLDCFLTGNLGLTDYSFLYRNDSGFFRHITTAFTPTAGGSVAWFDYDNDGDLDLILSGEIGTSLWRNDGNSTFANVSVGSGLPTGDWYTSISCGDYDNDGNTDLMLNGVLMRNLGNGKWIVAHLFPNPQGATNAMGDFDNDGDLDLFLSGPGVSAIYRNDGPAGFVDLHAGTDTLQNGSAKTVDFDNDGHLDLFQTGYQISMTSETIARTHLYHNDGFGHFIPVAVTTATGGGSSDWGDFDNDGDVDLLLTGSGTTKRLAAVYRNDGVPPNVPPTAPAGLTSQIVGNQLTMSWSPSTDDHTPSLGLSYNVRVGTQPGRDDIMPCMADPVAGTRRITRLGNASERTWMKMQLPPAWDVLYWSVQAIDGSYAGSPFGQEQLIGGSVPALPTNISAKAGPDGVRLLWYLVGTMGETNTVYRRESGSDWITLGTALPGEQTLSFTDTSARPGTRYAYRLGIPDGQAEVFTEDVWVDVPEGSVSFALEPIQPNPAPGGSLHATFSLATAAPASLALVDTRGRVLTTESFSGPGRYTASVRTSHLENGRYFLRLEQAGRTLVRALTVVE